MMPLDDELRKALRRSDPGPEFTARVLARAAEAAAAPPRESLWQRFAAGFRFANARWAAAAAMACLMVAAGVEYRERQTRIEGEAAKQQLVRALHIAGSKLNQAREKVRELNVPRGDL
jgi:anti-sigma-K factor RskA